jgi:hypothetical protein
VGPGGLMGGGGDRAAVRDPARDGRLHRAPGRHPDPQRRRDGGHGLRRPRPAEEARQRARRVGDRLVVDTRRKFLLSRNEPA